MPEFWTSPRDCGRLAGRRRGPAFPHNDLSLHHPKHCWTRPDGNASQVFQVITLDPLQPTRKQASAVDLSRSVPANFLGASWCPFADFPVSSRAIAGHSVYPRSLRLLVQTEDAQENLGQAPFCPLIDTSLEPVLSSPAVPHLFSRRSSKLPATGTRSRSAQFLRTVCQR